MKAFKKFLIYLACIVGIILLVVLFAFAILYFAPGTSILGYEYVLYNKNITTVFNTVNSDPLVTGIQAVEIVTDQTDIYIYPNTKSDELMIFHMQGLTGYAKSINADLNVITTVETKSFEENPNSYKTFCINVDEPTGWIAKSKAIIYVNVPPNISLNTIHARSNSGNIYYMSENKDKEGNESVLNCTNLYMKTSEFGQLHIQNKHNVSNYYLTTSSGKVSFDNVSEISGNKIKFETDTGLFSVTNAAGDATLKLSDKLEIKSYSSNSGPTVLINKLNCNMNVEARSGKYSINNIGSFGSQKTIAMTLNKGTIDFDNVYGFLSILGDGEGVANNINIDLLENRTKEKNILECGAGSVYIGTLNSNVAIDATSGNIKINKAEAKNNSGSNTASGNIDCYTTSGNIDISYIESTDTTNKDVKLTVLTRTGNINLNNISCALQVEVMEDSLNSNLNIVWTAVAAVDNKINARNRKVNLTVKGVDDTLQFRIASTSAVKIIESVGEEIIKDIDQDDLFVQTEYEAYNYQYRIGYVKGNDTYNSAGYDMWGKVLISTTNSTTLRSVAK